jgi:hypothetical protein
MHKAIRAHEIGEAADLRLRATVGDLRTAKINTAAELGASETLTYIGKDTID